MLFDASSLVNLVVEGGGSALNLAKGGYILDLTPYEAGNALWKMYALKKKIGMEDAKLLVGAVERLMKRTNSIPARNTPLTQIMETTGRKVTFYDASYLVAARLNKLTLMTDDAKLAGAARKYVKVGSSKDLLEKK